MEHIIRPRTKVKPTHADSRHSFLFEDPHVERLALKVLQPCDCVDRVSLGVDVDGIDGYVVKAGVLLHLGVIMIVRRELRVGIARI